MDDMTLCAKRPAHILHHMTIVCYDLDSNCLCTCDAMLISTVFLPPIVLRRMSFLSLFLI
jgi:hypothetical protein